MAREADAKSQLLGNPLTGENLRQHEWLLNPPQLTQPPTPSIPLLPPASTLPEHFLASCKGTAACMVSLPIFDPRPTPTGDKEVFCVEWNP